MNKESYSFEARILIPDDTIREVFSTSKGQYDEKGNLQRLIGIVQDITDRKLAIQSIQASEEKFRQIYNNILDVYYEASLDGIILEIIPSIERISQYKREEIIGKSLYDIYADPLERDALIENLLIKGSVRDYEYLN